MNRAGVCRHLKIGINRVGHQQHPDQSQPPQAHGQPEGMLVADTIQRAIPTSNERRCPPDSAQGHSGDGHQPPSGVRW